MEIGTEHLNARDRFRLMHPEGIVSVGFRRENGRAVMHVLYWKDQEFEDVFEGFPVVIQKSGKGILC